MIKGLAAACTVVLARRSRGVPSHHSVRRVRLVAASAQTRRAMSAKPPGGADAAVRLYDRCVEVLGDRPAGVPFTPEDVASINPYLDAVEPENVGLVPPTCLPNGVSNVVHRLSARDRPPLNYVKLHDSPTFNMGVFCLPRGGVLPLHNHPGMTVLSKLLYGSMRVRSFDWVDAATNPAPGTSPGVPRLARVVANRELVAPTAPVALYPAVGGNLHELTATTPCALLDVMAPPYQVGNGRDCHYFEEVAMGPGGEPAEEGHTWLVGVECPENFRVVRAQNRGPRFGSEAR